MAERKKKYSSGDKVGKNQVELIRYVEKGKNRQWKCEFKCNTIDCNNTFIVYLNSVSSGNSQYCEKCNTLKSKKRGQQVGKQSYKKDYTKDNSNPFYSFIERTEKTDKDGISYWKIKCKKCGKEYEERPVYLISEKRRKGNNPCSCWRNSKKDSKGSYKIEAVLKENNIKYIREYSFIDCLSEKGNMLYFDFYLPKYNCCIEYDGEQHFFENSVFSQSLKEIENRDKIKNQYCKDNNIKLIRIPYFDYIKINIQYLKEKGVFSGESI